jgi:DNA-binding NarL/FixJ family response regulator
LVKDRGNNSDRVDENNVQAVDRTAREPSRIVVADDHPLFRSAIRYTLEAQPDLEVLGEAADGREAVELCRRLRPELVLMDLRMPLMDGVAATRIIKERFPGTRVLILTALDESAGLSDSLEAGASGYVLKDAPASRIIDAVRRTLAGESPLDDKVAMGLLMSLMGSGTQEEGDRNGRAARSSASERPLAERDVSRPPDSLTPREAEVLRLLVRGQTNQQIARNLLISVSTVKRHIRHISAKLGVRERVQVGVRAIELGLLDERKGG